MHDRKAIVRIVVLSLLLYALVSFAAAQGELRQTRQTESRLREELAQLTSENAALERALSTPESDEQMRQLARERLGMVMPGEKIFYFYDR